MSTPVTGSKGLKSETHPRVLGLEGARLSAVEFVGGNWKTTLLRFDQGRLEILGRSALRVGERSLASGEKAWGEGLLARVGARVAHVVVDPGHRLEFVFDDGSCLVVSLALEDRVGPDCAAFFDDKWNYEPY
jgi:hypothetical protein